MNFLLDLAPIVKSTKVGQKKETKTGVKFEVHHTNNKALRLKSGETQVPIGENLGASYGSFDQESSPK